jgi:hypothetical protein
MKKSVMIPLIPIAVFHAGRVKVNFTLQQAMKAQRGVKT